MPGSVRFMRDCHPVVHPVAVRLVREWGAGGVRYGNGYGWPWRYRVMALRLRDGGMTVPAVLGCGQRRLFSGRDWDGRAGMAGRAPGCGRRRSHRNELDYSPIWLACSPARTDTAGSHGSREPAVPGRRRKLRRAARESAAPARRGCRLLRSARELAGPAGS